MNAATALKSDRQDIVVDEIFPHAAETIWKVLTSGALMGRWLMAPMYLGLTVALLMLLVIFRPQGILGDKKELNFNV